MRSTRRARMFRIPRNARVIAVAIAAMVSTASHAAGEKTTSPKAMGASAEVQIGLCGAADHIVRALDLRPRGAPITVWQFDDDALTLLQRGLRLRLRVAVDGSSEYTLKVADQDCARLAPGRVPPRRGQVRIRRLRRERGRRGFDHAPFERERHRRAARRALGTGAGAQPRAGAVLAQSGPTLALAGRRRQARADRSPALSNQGRHLRRRYLSPSR